MPFRGYAHPDGLRRALVAILAERWPEDLCALEQAVASAPAGLRSDLQIMAAVLGNEPPPRPPSAARAADCRRDLSPVWAPLLQLVPPPPRPLSAARAERIVYNCCRDLSPVWAPLAALMRRWRLEAYPWAWKLLLEACCRENLRIALTAWHPSRMGGQTPLGVRHTWTGPAPAPEGRLHWPAPMESPSRVRSPGRKRVVTRQWTPEEVGAYHRILRANGYVPRRGPELLGLERLAAHLRNNEPLARPSQPDEPLGLDSYALAQLYRLKRLVLYGF